MRYPCESSLFPFLASAHICFSDVISEESVIFFNIFDRTDNDRFLGAVNIKPVLKHDHTVDQWYT